MFTCNLLENHLIWLPNRDFSEVTFFRARAGGGPYEFLPLVPNIFNPLPLLVITKVDAKSKIAFDRSETSLSRDGEATNLIKALRERINLLTL